MRKDGFTNLMGVDWCETLITQQNTAHPDIPHKATSATDFASAEGIGEGAVDYIIDKALLDSILVFRNILQHGVVRLVCLTVCAVNHTAHCLRAGLFVSRSQLLTAVSLQCGANSTQNAFMYLKECHKALKPGRSYSPGNRLM